MSKPISEGDKDNPLKNSTPMFSLLTSSFIELSYILHNINLFSNILVESIVLWFPKQTENDFVKLVKLFTLVHSMKMLNYYKSIIFVINLPNNY